MNFTPSVAKASLYESVYQIYTSLETEFSKTAENLEPIALSVFEQFAFFAIKSLKLTSSVEHGLSIGHAKRLDFKFRVMRSHITHFTI